MQNIYGLDEEGRRRLKFFYHQSGIQSRYSVISDYSRPAREWKFYPASENMEPFPALEQRMQWYSKYAPPLSVDAVRECLAGKLDPQKLTHLITVSCTGMSAPGLDLQVAGLMDLPRTIFRTSVNFMGCYAAIHALKLANALCEATPGSAILVLCTELCTLHFQRESTMDNMMSSLLFGDGAAAALVVNDDHPARGLRLGSFYSEIVAKGRKDMVWELSSSGFQMTLSNYIPELIETDFAALVARALQRHGLEPGLVSHWCVHPGGRRILEAIHKSMQLASGHLDASYEVLKEYGNMSSPTILFVLQRMMERLDYDKTNLLFGAAFGPGLTIETFIADTVSSGPPPSIHEVS